MSDGHTTEGVPMGQGNLPPVGQNFETLTISFEMGLGFITRRSLKRVAGVSNDTILLWEERELLKPFRPGTKTSYYRVEDVRQMFAQAPNFAGVSAKRKPKRRRTK